MVNDVRSGSKAQNIRACAARPLGFKSRRLQIPSSPDMGGIVAAVAIVSTVIFSDHIVY